MVVSVNFVEAYQLNLTGLHFRFCQNRRLVMRMQRIRDQLGHLAQSRDWATCG